MNSNGILKIADFGLAKFYGSPNRQYTHMVVTRWYRAPELLFGARNYGTGVDVWAVGCILAELLLRIPFVAGDTDLDQLGKIFQVCNYCHKIGHMWRQCWTRDPNAQGQTGMNDAYRASNQNLN